MARVTILGAGDMGTALATPLAANGHDVRLWGTHLDREIVGLLQGGGPHPRLKTPLPAGVRVFADGEAGAALAGAEIAVVAVTSSAVRSVIAPLASRLAGVGTLLTVAKGFERGPDGQVLLLPDVLRRHHTGPVVAVGGPSKANEVAAGQPTAVVFAGEDAAAVARCRDAFATESYHVESSADPVGVEVAAAMKNAYAVALGVADGLERRTGRPHHNLKAALFPRAVAEMGALAAALGGQATTVAGLAGAGDLQVTITSGRNRLLGERIGGGEAAAAAAAALAGGGTTIEGYAAAAFGHELATAAVASGRAAPGTFPVLDALHAVLYRAAPPEETLWAAVRGTGVPALAAVPARGMAGDGSTPAAGSRRAVNAGPA
ncbi:MAG: Glycerol-3-phosphate dehydrogenase [NAD(P)+] [uncultured Thermomicrobiales bacterium]|uniref:Glycerol-3-phosphate dehydrogenase n=1 Tax=uncultured Thermomicrobiales bacterium TaxID=1645740 RepID=A0A6J4U5T2_9BACT|nr:MAG: Glycerol-3-phosphate dehydrogenase [NAD(P)+] [uncultured Thermomicrobiales bacterium]